MIVSDQHKFVFIHIPKCAGTSVRTAILPYHDADKRFLRTVEPHPELGSIDFRHLPLSLLRDLDPEVFGKLKTYDSYALLRDPFQRFRSAMSQRAKMYLGREFAQLGTAELRTEIGRVQDYLLSAPSVIKPEFVHFTRQSDFVEIDGERMVQNIFPVEHLDRFARAIARRIGIDELPMGHANKTTVFRYPQLKHVAQTGSAVARRVLPGTLHDTLRRSARKMLMKSGASTEQPVFAETQVRDFIANYYKADIALYKEVVSDVVVHS